MRTEDEVRRAAAELVHIGKMELAQYKRATGSKDKAERLLIRARILGMLRTLSWVLGKTEGDLIDHIREEKTK
jgi:hypothetical protein